MGESNDNKLIGFIANTIETMRDEMATKADIGRLEAKISVEATAIRGDIEQVHVRLDAINARCLFA